jgi:hypothetical protein
MSVAKTKTQMFDFARKFNRRVIVEFSTRPINFQNLLNFT